WPQLPRQAGIQFASRAGEINRNVGSPGPDICRKGEIVGGAQAKRDFSQWLRCSRRTAQRWKVDVAESLGRPEDSCRFRQTSNDTLQNTGRNHETCRKGIFVCDTRVAQT